MKRIPKTGEFYRDIENKLYQIAAVAEHTETGEELVIYQALYGTYRVYASPLSVFNRKADSSLHPQAQQEYVFEPVKFLAKRRGTPKNFPDKPGGREVSDEEEFLDSGSEFEELLFEDPFDELFHGENRDEEVVRGRDEETKIEINKETEEESHKETEEEAKNEATKWLEYFLDADGYEKQLEILAQMRGKVGQRELGSICLVLGIPVLSGDEDMQMANIIKHLETRMHYDTRRLR